VVAAATMLLIWHGTYTIFAIFLVLSSSFNGRGRIHLNSLHGCIHLRPNCSLLPSSEVLVLGGGGARGFDVASRHRHSHRLRHEEIETTLLLLLLLFFLPTKAILN
jgi:hypothetical protein